MVLHLCFYMVALCLLPFIWKMDLDLFRCPLADSLIGHVICFLVWLVGGLFACFLLFGTVGAIFGVPYIIYHLVRGADLVINPSGIVGGLGGRHRNLVTWDQVADLRQKPDSNDIIISMKDRKDAVVIDLEFYRIGTEEFGVIISEYVEAYKRESGPGTE
jgi:hypothetical protein